MENKSKPLFVYKLARFGALSLGVVYAMIGVVALLSLLQLKQGGADNSSILNMLNSIPFGNVLVGTIFCGLAGFIVWKFYNAVADPYGYGDSYRGLGKRAAIAAGGAAYATIAFSAVEAFFDLSNSTHGSPQQQQLLVAKVFQWWAGEWLVGLLGLLIGITGIAQFVYVFRKGYREKLVVQQISELKKKAIGSLAWLGHFARGIILLIIAYFLVVASLQSQPSEVVNTDKAFNYLGEKIGHFVFVVVAIGTICYGLYLFALSFYFDFEDDF